ncbi:MAG: gamma-glutamylcyclotransferase family protein [Candidatus Hodarchaeota archaeon]
MKRCINRIPKSKKAVLNRLKKILDPFFPYPFLIKDSFGRVKGLCYFGLSHEEIEELDRYESFDRGFYRREKVVIDVRTNGKKDLVEAEVYVGDMLEKKYKKNLEKRRISE